MALEMPDRLHVDLDAALAAAIRGSPPARWIPAEKRHLTLVFLGQIESSSIQKLDGPLAAVCAACPPLRLELGGGGVFPTGKAANVVWVGFVANERLVRLQREAAETCRELGLASERRSFLPHLTLARCRPPWPVAAGEAWRAASSKSLTQARSIGPYQVDKATLFESIQTAVGVSYRVIRAYPLSQKSNAEPGPSG